MANVHHSTVQVGPANVFYREAGVQGQPVLLLLHGCELVALFSASDAKARRPISVDRAGSAVVRIYNHPK